MANIFTRSKYDPAELQMHDATVRNTNDYVMNLTSAENTNSCYAPAGARNTVAQISRPLNNEGFLDFGSKIDIENKLLNRHLPLNSFDRTNKDYAQVQVSTPNTCGSVVENLTNEDSRFTHPITDFREMNTANYKFTPYLHMNPQNVVIENTSFMPPLGRGGVSSRDNAKKDRYSREGARESVKSKTNLNIQEIHKNLLPKNIKPVPAYESSNTV